MTGTLGLTGESNDDTCEREDEAGGGITRGEVHGGGEVASSKCSEHDKGEDDGDPRPSLEVVEHLVSAERDQHRHDRDDDDSDVDCGNIDELCAYVEAWITHC